MKLRIANERRPRVVTVPNFDLCLLSSKALRNNCPIPFLLLDFSELRVYRIVRFIARKLIFFFVQDILSENVRNASLMAEICREEVPKLCSRSLISKETRPCSTQGTLSTK